MKVECPQPLPAMCVWHLVRCTNCIRNNNSQPTKRGDFFATFYAQAQTNYVNYVSLRQQRYLDLLRCTVYDVASAVYYSGETGKSAVELHYGSIFNISEHFNNNYAVDSDHSHIPVFGVHKILATLTAVLAEVLPPEHRQSVKFSTCNQELLARQLDNLLTVAGLSCTQSNFGELVNALNNPLNE